MPAVSSDNLFFSDMERPSFGKLLFLQFTTAEEFVKDIFAFSPENANISVRCILHVQPVTKEKTMDSKIIDKITVNCHSSIRIGAEKVIYFDPFKIFFSNKR